MPGSVSALHCCLSHQIANSHHIVGGHRKGESPPNPIDATKPGLAISSDGFHPAEDLLHSFANTLTDQVALGASGASINGGADFALRNVRGGIQLAQLFHTRCSVVALIHANGDPVSCPGSR